MADEEEEEELEEELETEEDAIDTMKADISVKYEEDLESLQIVQVRVLLCLQ